MPRYTVSSNELTHLNGEPVSIGDVVELPAGTAARRMVAADQLTEIVEPETEAPATPTRAKAKARKRGR